MTDDKPRPDIVGVWEFTADEMDLLDLKEGDRLGMVVVGPPRTEPDWREQLLERVDEAIDVAMAQHESQFNDSVCSCGVVNNMDGDVLHGHRVGAVSAAVRSVLDPPASPTAGTETAGCLDCAEGSCLKPAGHSGAGGAE
jgi:hypothetical protein